MPSVSGIVHKRGSKARLMELSPAWARVSLMWFKSQVPEMHRQQTAGTR
ncbi:hypothetical protein [Rhodococcoides fascians]|nr:hypothetical protein [Rhodococcus fascians]